MKTRKAKSAPDREKGSPDGGARAGHLRGWKFLFPSLLSTEISAGRRAGGFLSAGAIALVVTAATIGVRQTGVLQSLELATFDRLVLLMGERPADPRLLIVGISEADLRQVKTVPLPDGILASAIEKLQEHRPKVIGLDIHRDMPQSSGIQSLYKQLAAPNVIAIRKGGDRESDRVLPPEIVPENRVGFSDLLVDVDNAIRRYLLYVELSEREKYQSFALRVALQYLGERGPLRVTPDALTIGDAVFPDLPPAAGGYRLDETEALGWQTLLRYRSADRVADRVSLSDLLAGKVDPALIRDRIVLIGYTAPSVKDLFITPYSSISPPATDRSGAEENRTHLMPGVIIHAQMISGILDSVLAGQKPIRFLPEWGEWLWILGWSLVGGVIVRYRERPLSWVLGMALAIGGLWGICVLAFSGALWLPAIPPALGAILTGAIVLGQKAYYSLYHDSLTDLPNRRALVRDLERQRGKSSPERPRSIAVLFLDIDRFKMFNEGLGHRGGDRVLLTIAGRLREICHSGERLARIGGDEFAIWFFSSEGDRAVTLARDLQEALARPIPWEDREVYAGASIGIAIGPLDRTFRAEEILRNSHIAMGTAKVKGGGRHEIFTPRSKRQAEARLQLETELRRALDRQEFQLYYQPIVSLRTGKLAGFEALIRWPSAERGFISPGQFIPIAEETGIIVPLGQWILRSACRQMREWHELYKMNPPPIVSVNLSSRQFGQPDLVPQIQKIVQEEGIDRDSLKLEITESMMMNDVEEAIELLTQLKGLGLRLSIDDFGTGYSNLSYLHRFPVDTLKVDQSFVRRLHEGDDSDRYLQIVRTVVTLGHNLHLDVIAEGIETEAQMNTLKSLDCEYGQGYYFSKPLPSEEAARLLERDPRW
ncbi:EAL domain-containing protein [Pannus brasiliensis CCIBt3594]|uniref:EAL domain-containing protein n=1 Tax=Pannus brasiliensis CCIBt3594 TaxID=1427578 RepID=A0AAW9QV54_9CHRO